MGLLGASLVAAGCGGGADSASAGRTDSVLESAATTTGQVVPPTTVEPPAPPAPGNPPEPSGDSVAALEAAGEALRRGSSGKRVVALQRALATIGHDPGPADGDFGARTETAVKAFQTAVGLGSDGVVGTKTIEKINERLATARG